MAFNMGMPGNPFVDRLIERGSISDGEANYLATMTLAHEVRTANLIALLTDGNEPIPGIDYNDLAVQIKARMGF